MSGKIELQLIAFQPGVIYSEAIFYVNNKNFVKSKQLVTDQLLSQWDIFFLSMYSQLYGEWDFKLKGRPKNLQKDEWIKAVDIAKK